MNRTKIEWVKNPDGTQGYTWNPITGCLNGCEYCYARKLANGRLRTRYLANTHIAPTSLPYNIQTTLALRDPFYPRFWGERMKEQFGDFLMGAMPKGIFVCDMSDLFGIGIPEEWTRRVLEKISQPWYREHRFYLLTKQPQNLIKFSPFSDNCWVGVTATNQVMFRTGITYLAEIKAAKKYVSLEPLLDWGAFYRTALEGWLRLLDQVIIGVQTKPYKPPKIEWAQEIVQACRLAGIPIFLKDNLAPIIENRKLIQEMPV